MSRHASDLDFAPGLLLRNPHVQSTLASRGLRSWLLRGFARRLGRESDAHVLDCGDGVRLQGFHTRTDAAPGLGLVVVLHGWEGSASSTYVVGLTRHLLASGFDVFRLNFRDHGETHHLNQGVFHSCRLDEVVGAVRAIAARFADGPMFLAGFSLGGNFAIRAAIAAGSGDPQIRRIVAICPVVDPAHCLEAIERAPAYYQRHFLKKWKGSLRRKHEAFPERYDPAHWTGMTNLREMTRYLVETYLPYPSMEAYLSGYSIAGPRMQGLTTPTTVVAAIDDPVIPVRDVLETARPPSLAVEVLPRGGHCGFVDRLSGATWIERRTVAALSAPEPS
jgi:predicted alpha/beta-fold hydrolase